MPTDDMRFEEAPQQFVSVPSPNFIYVGIKDRAAFDMIAALSHDHGLNDNGHVLTKTVEQNGVRVVFQYWIKSRTVSSLLEQRRQQVPASNA